MAHTIALPPSSPQPAWACTSALKEFSRAVGPFNGLPIDCEPMLSMHACIHAWLQSCLSEQIYGVTDCMRVARPCDTNWARAPVPMMVCMVLEGPARAVIMLFWRRPFHDHACNHLHRRSGPLGIADMSRGDGLPMSASCLLK